MVADAHQHSGSAETLVGRGAELARIVDGLESAKRATPFTLLVEGTPGVGKTALLDVACELARERGFVVWRAKGSLMERDVPFAVAQQLFEHLREELPPGRNGESTPPGYDLIAGHLTAERDDVGELELQRAIRDLYRFTADFAQRA